MGGYMISYEAFETYVQNQARMAFKEREKAELMVPEKARNFIGSAEGREEAVFELAKYLGVSETEVKKMWMKAI